MKRITALLFIMLLLCGCSVSDTVQNTDSRVPVTVNLPTDETVNGYRTVENSSDSEMPDRISAGDTEAAAQPDDPAAAAVYIGNKNSHVFHKPSCSSAEKMKEENKVSFKSRDAAERAGYKPCGQCKP